MSIQRKAATAKAYLNGSRQISDRSFFWNRPNAWIGGEWVNRLGLQPLRCIWQHLKHLPDASRAGPELREQAQQLIDSGMVVIPDFLSDQEFGRIKVEYERAFDASKVTHESVTENAVNKRVSKLSGTDGVHTAVSRGVHQESSPISADEYPDTTEYLLQDERILSLISAALGRDIKYNPGAYFQKEYSAPGADGDSEQNIILHEDVYYPSFKVFYYINDNTPENGAFIVAPNSHQFNLKRLKHEYVYSVDIARQKKGKSVSHPRHESGRMQVFGRVYTKEELREVQAVGKANTLIIANTMAFHRRGGSSPTERQQVRMCFRHVETWHHRLYPYFGTKRSQRLKAGSYF